MYVMSPTIFSPGAPAVKSRCTRSGMACSWPSPSVRLNRHGRGWQDSRPSSRITERTSSGPAGTPQAARGRYAEVTAPVHLIYGDKDWSRPSDREANRRLLPRAEFIQVRNASHFIELERPDVPAGLLNSVA
jgi:pimeloyl-ACP methyl ester carboxylesterase